MSSLMERMAKSGTIKASGVMSQSEFFNNRESTRIPTKLPILNMAFTGSLDGGLVPGLTIFAGESKSFKTLLGLYCMRAYFDKYPDAIALVYDSEFGITPEYLSSMGIDTDRVLHAPIMHVEQLKFDIVKRLEEIKKNDHVFIMVDSLGALASKKEVEDAIDEKSAADMTRAKAIRSLLRIITPHLTMKNIPCIVINHIYMEMGQYPKAILGGGTSVLYAANQAFIITKSQEKEGEEFVGWNFKINIEKSRFVREKEKFPFTVTFEGGINPYSGLLPLAMEANLVVKPAMGWYQLVDPATGELIGKKTRMADTCTEDFLGKVLKLPQFAEFVEKKYRLGTISMMEEKGEFADQLLNDIMSIHTEDDAENKVDLVKLGDQ